MTKRKIRFSAIIIALVAVIALGCVGNCFATSATSGEIVNNAGTDSSNVVFDKNKAIADLKEDLIKSINQDLIKQIDDYNLSGAVNAIITFSEDSLVNEYNEKYSGKMTLDNYLRSNDAERFKRNATQRQNRVAQQLVSAGLVSNVKYGYSTIMDGVYVSTTYANLSAIANYGDVKRIIVSNTYLPAVATENAVNVYETGIFNSSDVAYTGKDTVVAILDTGCDYTHTAFTTHQVENPHYNRDDIARILPNTVAYGYDQTVEAREVYYGNITANKIAWGYDYADKDPDVMPFASEHGTHVAGIIGGYDNVITGVAIDTQLAIMKVFSDYKDGADDGDILAALEDCVQLGVDAINMSLGTSCGFTREIDDVRKNEIYKSIEDAGISLVVAASNDYSSAYASEFGNTNKTRNPDSATVGAPSTYTAAMSVASINGNKDKYMLANGEREVFFLESFNQSAKEYNFFEMMGITQGVTKTFEYVTIPGYGYAANYIGADVQGKIALIKRGDISFEEKVKFAYENGAIAAIIYNNVFGDIVMTVGNDVKIPVVSIGKDDGDILAAVNKGKENEGRGTLEFTYSNQAGPFMSDFSSWGPNPDLTLKPEITAHGGNIWSAVPGGGYEKLSGTSMACPNMCGITILIRQYVKENFPNLSTCEVRDMVNQLCMSTATIALDKKGNPYSPRKQGAGIADIKKATSTDAFLYVDGIGKTKLELGDDVNRTGVYTMSVNLKNISDRTVSYRLGNLTMTETLSSSDKDYVAEMAYMLNNSASYSVENGTLSNGIVSVGAHQTAKVNITIALSARDKGYISNNFENGMYVEGFITFDNTNASGVDLNVPYIAFYGDWSDAPIFDEDYYVVETEAHNGAIDDDDKIKADYYATTPLAKYYYDYIIPMGSYVYEMSADDTPIPATAEHAALSYYKDALSGIYAVFTGLLRGAREMSIEIVNTATGEVVWNKTETNCYKAHYSGIQYPYVCNIDLDMANTRTGEVFGDNNAHYQVTMSAKLDWDGSNERNVNDTYQFSFYIDYEAPLIVDSQFRTEYDKNREENRYYVDLTVYDNHYAMSLRPVVLYSYNDNGTQRRTYASLSKYAIPVYQQTRGSQTLVTVEITDYLDQIRNSAMPQGITFYIDDFAMNSNVYYIPFPEADCATLEFENQVAGNRVPTIELKKGETFDLTTIMYDSADINRVITRDYLKQLTWTSSNPSVVSVSGGKIEALKNNSGIRISVKGETWPKSKEIIVNIVGETNDPSSSQNVQVEKIEFTSYDTIYAYNGDIDYSEIGKTGGIGYFDGNYTLNFYPGEVVKLHYTIEPWNLPSSRYQLRWSSSNERVATVDDNGEVKGISEGRARIYLNIIVDGRESILQASCTINIKSEFVIENRELVAYKGLGGEVIIPDDKGILYIGSFAFCHYNLDNEKEVGDKYDLDEKKEPLGNNSVTKVIIPDGIEEIRKYAFYNCEVLREVVLGADCDKIMEYAFYRNPKLININLDKVKVISNYAFYECSVLSNYEKGGLNFASVNVLGDYAFAKCKQLLSANLTDLRRSGTGVFKECSKLETVVLGDRAHLGKEMFSQSAVRNITVYCDTIPDGAFNGCSRLEWITIVNDLTYLGNEAFRDCVRLTDVFFQGGCEYIGAMAFYGCARITSVTLPDCDIAMGDNVFGTCSSLAKITLNPNTQFNKVGAAIFNGLGSTNLTIDASNSNYYKVTNNVLFSKDGTKLILALTNNTFSSGTYTVPSSVREICDGAFSANRNLRTVNASAANLTRIGESAFAYCNNLTAVDLGNGKVAIGDRAFCEANNLRNIELNNAVSIGEFAFYNTSVTTAHFADNATIGYKAFSAGNSTVTDTRWVSRLTNVYLGANNVIGAYAFADSAVITVSMPQDGGVVVGAYAFYDCESLEIIDISKAATLSEYSFACCSKLTSVDLGALKEVPEGCFSGCSALNSLTAKKVVSVGKDAFSQFEAVANLFVIVVEGPSFTSVSLPKAKTIGEYAFYGCMNLQEISMPNVTSIGTAAFQFCEKLETVSLNSKLTEIANGVFYGCEALDISQLDLSHIERVGAMSFLGTKIPETLTLANINYIGSQAFGEAEREYDSTGNFDYVPTKNPVLKTVNAPNLETLNEYAFYGNGALKKLNAPKLKEIGYMAFSSTAFEEFEIYDSLENVSYGAFYNAEKLKAFYSMQNGKKAYTATLTNVKLYNGVLYTSAPKGYILCSYPTAKQDAKYSVMDGTIRIEFMSGAGNQYLNYLVLPESVKYIGNMAFFNCDNLKTVEFHSYYAPVLEGTMSLDINMLPKNVQNGDYPKFDLLYKYDFYYYDQLKQIREAEANGESYTPSYGVPYPLQYANFVDVVTSKKASALSYVIPNNCEGYDNMLYKAYFNASAKTSGDNRGRFATDFIDAVANLPDVIDRFNEGVVSEATTAYNALLRHKDELSKVDQAVIDKYLKAVSDCNVDLTNYYISKLIGIDATERSFNLIVRAQNAFNALSATDKSRVTDYNRLQQAVAQYNKAISEVNEENATANTVATSIIFAVANISALLGIAYAAIKKILGGAL